METKKESFRQVIARLDGWDWAIIVGAPLLILLDQLMMRSVVNIGQEVSDAYRSGIILVYVISFWLLGRPAAHLDRKEWNPWKFF